MNQTATFFYVNVGQLKHAAAFFEDYLEVVAEEVVMYDKEKRLLVKHNDTHILLSEQRNQNQTNQIILHTADCLANYCRLKAKGIHFKKEPSYLNEGLCIVFADPFGNEYTLLEERSYSEI